MTDTGVPIGSRPFQTDDRVRVLATDELGTVEAALETSVNVRHDEESPSRPQVLHYNADQLERLTPAGDLGLCDGGPPDEYRSGPGVRPDGTEPHRTTDLARIVDLWVRDGLHETAGRRSVRAVWPDLGVALDDLLDEQDGGGER